MRQVIINRINEIKEESGNFPMGMRWARTFYGTKIKDVKYEELHDEVLLAFFELIIRRYNAQM